MHLVPTEANPHWERPQRSDQPVGVKRRKSVADVGRPRQVVGPRIAKPLGYPPQRLLLRLLLQTSWTPDRPQRVELCLGVRSVALARAAGAFAQQRLAISGIIASLLTLALLADIAPPTGLHERGRHPTS